MAYVTIPKDLTKVKSKVLFGLTKRQLICFGAAALIGVPLFFLLRRTASNSAAAFCMIISVFPCGRWMRQRVPKKTHGSLWNRSRSSKMAKSFL